MDSFILAEDIDIALKRCGHFASSRAGRHIRLKVFLGDHVTIIITVLRMHVTHVDQKIRYNDSCTIKRVWPFSGISQRIAILAHITCCS